MMAGNIAVFGGNGLTGSEVVYQALERGDKVTAFCRDPSKLTVRTCCLFVPPRSRLYKYCIPSSSLEVELEVVVVVVVVFPRDVLVRWRSLVARFHCYATAVPKVALCMLLKFGKGTYMIVSYVGPFSEKTKHL